MRPDYIDKRCSLNSHRPDAKGGEERFPISMRTCASEGKLDRIQGRNRLTELEIHNTLLCTSNGQARKPVGRGQRHEPAWQQAACPAHHPRLVLCSGEEATRELEEPSTFISWTVELEHQTKYM